MYKGNNDVGDFNGGEDGNLVTGLIIGGATLAVAGISFAVGAVTGRNSAAKENKRLMWVMANTKQERLRIFGKDEYKYLNELFSEDELDEAPITKERKSKAANN